MDAPQPSERLCRIWSVPKPSETLWPLKRHTLAKHQLLVAYLDAWIGIVGQRFRHMLLVDGFAGPGEYADGEDGSPIRMLKAYRERPDLDRVAASPHFLFIEADPRRADHLRDLVPEAGSGERWTHEVVTGDFSREFPARLAEFRRKHPQEPVFAFIDPFGAGDEAAELASELVQSPRAEVLIYVPTSFLNRFATQPDFEQTMDKLYGSRERWIAAREIPAGPARRQFLQNAFAERMQESCKWVRFFEITPAEGTNSYTLFFGTSHPLGLERMKDAMWKLDPDGGASFRDSTMVDEPVLFEPEPLLSRLESQLREKFGFDDFSIEQAEEFTLFETAFRHNGHLKATLREAETSGRLEPVTARPTKRKTYGEGTVVRFLPQLGL